MADRTDGGPAFPVALPATVRPQGGTIEAGAILRGGMSLRDYFAGQALAGLLSSTHPDHSCPTWEAYAACAYGHAEAMLKAREVTHA